MWLATLLLTIPLQDAEKTRVFEATRASVVALRTADGHGSGVILDASGLILTNAHVMISPEAYTVQVEGPRSALYKSAKLVGVHAKLDLALVKIDPSEHPIELKPLKAVSSQPDIGAPVYAVGYPSSHGGYQKVITGGEVLTVNHYIDGARYLEVSNEIWGGNSGGPLCNHRGEVVGIITLGITERMQRYGAAIPIDEYKPESFVPLRGRHPNPAAAHRCLQGAEELLKMAREGNRGAAHAAESLFTLALMEDIGNADTYFKIGMIRRNTGNPGSAISYITRALLLDPSPSGGSQHYAELGIALAEKGKKTEAHTVWQEGLAKYPDNGGAIWDAIAIDYWTQARHLEAALASRTSLRTFGPRANAMNEVYEKCLKRFDAAEKTELQRREGEIDARLAEIRAKGDAARKAGRAFVYPDCEQVLRGAQGMREGGVSLPSRPAVSLAADADAYTSDEVTRLFLDAQLAVGRDQVRSGLFDKAKETLQDIVKSSPKSPQAKEARTLLDVLKESGK